MLQCIFLVNKLSESNYMGAIIICIMIHFLYILIDCTEEAGMLQKGCDALTIASKILVENLPLIYFLKKKVTKWTM